MVKSIKDEVDTAANLEHERLELEKRRLKIESSFIYRNGGILITAAASVAAIVFSVAQTIIASIDKDKELALSRLRHEQTLESSENEANRQWAIKGTDFVIEHMAKIFDGTDDEQKRFRNLMLVAWPPELSEALFEKLETATTGTSREVWSSGREIIRKLGGLSEKFESRGNPSAIGFHSTSGWSYGKYQISTKLGTFAKYVAYLEKHYPDLAKIVHDSGGVAGAKAGTDEFKNAWRASRDNEEFEESQRGFIQSTHYDPLIAKVKDFLDVRDHSLALQNVIWSLSVQHGPTGADKLIRKALNDVDVKSATEKVLIDAIYDERSDVNKYFRLAPPNVKTSIKRRYTKERATALLMLQQEKN